MQLQKTNPKDLLLGLYLIFILIFATLDGLRDTFFPRLSILRDFFIFSLPMIFIIYSRYLKPQKDTIILSTLLFFTLTYTLLITSSVDVNTVYSRANLLLGGLSFWLKYLSFFFIFIFIFILMKKDRDRYVKNIIFNYILLSLVYSLLTIIIIFIFKSYYLSLPSRNWHGRLSIGYPTQDVLVLSIGILFTFLNKNIKNYLKLLIIAILLTCIIMQNNVTGFVLLFFLLGLFFYKSKIIGKLLAATITAVIIYLIQYIYLNFQNFGTFGSLLNNKIDSFIFGTQNSGSLDLRQEQINLLLHTISSDHLFLLFGYGGIGGFSAENSFYSILAFSGCVGLIIYISTLLFVFHKSIKHKDLFLFCLLFMYLISSISITSYYLISGYFIYAFLLAYSLTIKAEKNQLL